jgi:aminomethyltransferase
MIPNANGGAIDDAYLYRFLPEEYLLVVNASNRMRDWEHFQGIRKRFDNVELEDLTAEMAMLSLQGPASRAVLEAILGSGSLPEPMRNRLSMATLDGARLLLARTGYTGEPIGFELFIHRQHAPAFWDRLVSEGIQPVGLGARDTLRLEAALPLYGHELGLGPEGDETPVFASNLARFAVSFSPLKGDWVGREVLTRQFEAFRRIVDRDFSRIADLPRLIQPIALLEKGVARAGAPVKRDGRVVGVVTSGTMVPYWISAGNGIDSVQTEEKGMRAIGLALLSRDPSRYPGQADPRGHRPLPPSQRGSAKGLADRLGGPAPGQAPGLCRRRCAAEGPHARERCHPQYRLATEAMHQPHPLRTDDFSHGAAAFSDGSCGALR